VLALSHPGGKEQTVKIKAWPNGIALPGTSIYHNAPPVTSPVDLRSRIQAAVMSG